MDDAWTHIRGMVEDALMLPVDARDEFLEDACSGNEEMLAEARSLLEFSCAAEGFLEPPAPADLGVTLTEDPSTIVEPGADVGAYRIVRVLSSGGMGVVFEAEQSAPRRRVALKMMKLDLISENALRRFRYEAEVLAQLRHPCIAQIYDTGVHVTGDRVRRELPWIAMEFVPGGRTILEYADERGLAIDDRVCLFIRVCDAIHHGHVKGVIHRDIKPDNVMVDEDGTPKVIDFGVARASAAELHLTDPRTETGRIVGTLQYMSPEQVAGRAASLDVRSDVYGLGVVLYELLTASLPYDLSSRPIHEVARVISESPPDRPKTLASDLQTIILKALEKEPERRYESAAHLARDLERFLEHEPVEARPPSVRYQLRMLARRNRSLVAAALLVFVAAIAATLVSVSYAVAARRSEKSAITRRNELQDERDRARQLAEVLLETSVATMFEAAARMQQIDGTTEVRERMLRNSLENLDHLATIEPTDRRIKELTVDACTALADVLSRRDLPNLGRSREAEAFMARAEATMSDLRRADPENDRYRRKRIDLDMRRAEFALTDGSPTLAEAILRDCRQAVDAHLRTSPDDPEDLDQLVRVLDRLGEAAGLQGDHRRAGELFRDKHGVVERLAAADDSPHARLQLAKSHGRIGASLMAGGRLEEAAEQFGRAVELGRALVAEDPGDVRLNVSLASNLSLLGRALGQVDRFEEAESRLREALFAWQKLSECDPADVHAMVGLADVSFMLGRSRARAAGRAAESADETGARAAWSSAAHHIERSFGVLQELESSNRLPGRLRGQLSRVRSELARCRRELEDLGDD